MKLKAPLLFAALSSLFLSAQAAPVTFIGDGDGSTWSDPDNWDTDTVPTAADDAVIPDLAGDVTINYTGGDATVLSLTCQESLNVASGGISVTTGASTIAGTLTIGNNAYVAANGVTATLTASGPASCENGNLYAENGGVLTLTNLTSMTRSVNGVRTFLADGANSLIDLPNLATFDPLAANGRELNFEALNGGRIQAPALTLVDDGSCRFRADGTNSSIQLSSLASFDGYLFFTDSGFRATNGGDIDCPALTTIIEGNLEIDATSTMDTAQITSHSGGIIAAIGAGPIPFTNLATFNNSVFDISVNVPSLPALTNIDSSSILLSGGLTLSLPSITTITGTINAVHNIQADGAGTVLSFPNLTTFDPLPANGRDFNVRALNGGRVEMPSLTIVDDGSSLFQADGAGSVLQLTSLATFDGYLFFTDSGFRVTNGGNIDAPVLTSLFEANLQIDATSTMQTAQIITMAGGGVVDADGTAPLPFTNLTNLNDVTLDIEVNVPTLPALSNIDGGSVVIKNGLSLSLPLVTSITILDGGITTLQADGAGSVLSFPNLATLDPLPSNGAEIVMQATNGGRLEMPNLTTVQDGGARFAADGAGSVVQLTNLESFDGYLFFTDSAFRATNGGTISTPSLLTLFEANVQIDATSTMDTAQITSFSGGGTLDINGTAPLPFTALTALNDVTLNISTNVPSLPNLSNIDGGSIIISNGLTLSLPLVTNITVQNGGVSNLQADGAGSVLSLPNLTTIDARPANGAEIITRATAGGLVEMPLLNTVIDGGCNFYADGIDSTIEITSLTTFDGYFFFTDSGFRATNNGLINLPPAATVDLTEAHLEASNGGVITAGTLLLQPSSDLIGNSTIEADVQSHGLINPGPTFGTLTIDGNFTQFNDGTLTFEIGGLVPGTSHDQLVVTGSATFDGTFNLNNSGSFAAFPEDEVTLLQFNSAAGSFPTLNLPSLGTELEWAPLWMLQSYNLTAEVTAGPWIIGDGTGWNAEYYDNSDLTNLLVTRVDPEINFVFAPSPDPSIGGDTFSARWCSTLLIPVSQDYTFYASTDDGARLWVDLDQNGTFDEPAELLIDFWINQNTERASAPVPLTAGELYNVKMEYYENNGGARAILSWSGANIAKSVVPTAQVYLKPDATNLADAPTISPVPDTYQNTVDVTLATTTGGADIRYTTDGSDPTAGSALYSGPLTFTATTTIKARAFGAGLDPSPTLIARYVIEQELPDLIVTSITPIASIAPGQTVNIEWTVQNVGIGSFDGTRVDAFALSPDNAAGGNDIGVAFYSITDILLPNESRTYQRSFTAPFQTPNGDIFLVATTDANDNQAESDQNNNATVAGTTTNIPAILTVTSPISSIAENEADPNFSLTLSRNGDISAALTVNLSADIAGELNLPATIDIPIGSYSTTVPVSVINDGITDGDQAVTVTASAVDYPNDTAGITVIDANPPSLALSLTDALITEGETTTLRITRNPVTASALTVNLSSSAPTQITMQATATILANEAFIEITVGGTDDNDLEGNQTLFINASAPAHLGASTQLALVDDDVPALTLSLSPSTISEADGALAATATITRTPVASTALTVELTNSDPSAATLAATAVIPAFSTSVDVPINATDDAAIDGPQIATIQAILRHPTTSEVLAQSTAEQLTVTDDEGPTFTITLSRDHVSEGDTTLAIIRREPVTGNSVTVNLASSDPSQATVPATVLLGPGVASNNFLITGVDDGSDDGTVNVEITASAAGFNSGLATIAVTDDQIPDLIVTNVNLPSEALTDELVTYSYRLENTGSGVLAQPVLVKVFLSDDQQFGNDTFLNQFLYEGGLPIDGSLDRTETFRAPVQSGDFWLLIQVDSESSVEEVVETNNIGLSTFPITLEAAYSATVSTDTTTAPSGTTIAMTGSATDPVLNGPAVGVAVDVHICVQGTCRIIEVVTDSNGNFTLDWEPLPNEAGAYTIGAVHPSQTTAPVQDSFALVGLGADPTSLDLALLVDGAPVTQLITLTNLGDVALSDLTATIVGAPNGITATPVIGDGSPNQSLAGFAEVDLALELSADNTAPPAASFNLRVTSTEGATQTIPVDLTVTPANSQLAVEPGKIKAGMVIGQQSFVSFKITNQGAIPTGPLQIVLPVAPWLRSATASPLPPLGPGQGTSITLKLAPDNSLPPGLFDGALLINGASTPLNVPFEFRATSSTTGDLLVTAEDEFTYYATGSPNIAGATVLVEDPFTRADIATGTTGPDGTLLIEDLPSGPYILTVTALDHQPSRSNITIAAGQTTSEAAFLPRTTVSYTWTVTPTTVVERTRITIVTEFETNVPAPVVTIKPSFIDLIEIGEQLDLAGEEETTINFEIENHGLIAAQEAKFGFTSTAEWQLTPLVEILGDIQARQKLIVPVRITRLGALPNAAGGCASPGGALVWNLICGNSKRNYRTSVGSRSGGGGCSGSAAVFPVGGGGGGAFITPRGSAGFGSCDPCLLKAAIDCFFGYLPCPISCPYALARAGYEGFINGDWRPAPIAGIGCIAGCLGTPLVGAAVNTIICFDAANQCQEGAAAGQAPGGAPPAPGAAAALQGLYNDWKLWRDHCQTIVDAYTEIFGDPDWFSDVPDQAFYDFVVELNDYIQTGTEAGNKISLVEESNLLALPTPANVTPTKVKAFIERWNRSLDYWDAGIFTVADVPAGQSTDFMDTVMLNQRSVSLLTALDAAQAQGFNDPVEGFIGAKDEVFSYLSGGGGVCARVKLQIEQEAVLTRQGFNANLEIRNSDDDPIEDLSVNLKVTTLGGQDVTELFTFGTPELTNVPGGDTIGPDSTGSLAWLIIPTPEAAPVEETIYLVSGSFDYMQDGVMVTVPLVPADISVLPSANLKLKYFQQRDVYADDPFTAPVEPSVPFSLAVSVENLGGGPANDLTITSSQPVIIENEKGLLIDFQIIGSQLDGEDIDPSLTVDFGDVGPGQTKTARWNMLCSLHGHFIDYEATFESQGEIGARGLSTISSVEIFEMVHEVLDPRPGADTLTDFLTNDLPDPIDLPDTVHLSDGTTAPVSVLQTATTTPPTTSLLAVPLTTSVLSGFTYLRVPEPSDGDFNLVGITRSDGRVIPLDRNFWVTDRTFIDFGLPPIREHILHLFDHDSTGSYTLFYGVTAPPDQTPPSSAVSALPATSFQNFIVQWLGSDNVATAFYDIFVSEDGGPFTLWQEATPLTNGWFEGDPGKTYEFFSVATDTSGNRESAPATADTSTSTSLVNLTPVLDPVANQVVVEGSRLNFQATASDPDSTGPVIFSLDPGAPSGLTINRITGQISWFTGETDGGRSESITVRATDAAWPFPSTTENFTIDVTDENSAPVLFPQFVVAAEGTDLTFNLPGSDPDVPVDTLTYRLGAGAPAGVALAPSTGELTWSVPEVETTTNVVIPIELDDNGVPPLTTVSSLTVTVQNISAPPSVLLANSTLTYTEGDGEALIDSVARVTDSDSENFNGGRVEITLSNAPDPEEGLVLIEGPLANAGDLAIIGNAVSLNATQIGTFAQQSNTSLVINLNLEATPVVVSSLLRHLAYSYPSENPVAGLREVSIVVDDGDGGVSLPAVRNVNVISVDDPPVAGPDFAATIQDTSIVLSNLLANDFDVEGDPFSIDSLPVATSANGGTLVRNGNTVTYTPPTGFTGTDSFLYTILSSTGASAQGTVTVDVSALPDFEPRITEISRQPGGTIRLIFRDAPARSFDVWGSPDLVNWTLLDTVTTGPDGTLQWDELVPRPELDYFYRWGAD